jgi:hypothetical protein
MYVRGVVLYSNHTNQYKARHIEDFPLKLGYNREIWCRMGQNLSTASLIWHDVITFNLLNNFPKLTEMKSLYIILVKETATIN